MKWTIAESGGKEAWSLWSNKNRIMVLEFWIKLSHHFLSESSTLFVGVQLEWRRRGLQQWVPGDSGWWRRRCSIHWKVWFYYCKSSSPVNKLIFLSWNLQCMYETLLISQVLWKHNIWQFSIKLIGHSGKKCTWPNEHEFVTLVRV